MSGGLNVEANGSPDYIILDGSNLPLERLEKKHKILMPFGKNAKYIYTMV